MHFILHWWLKPFSIIDKLQFKSALRQSSQPLWYILGWWKSGNWVCDIFPFADFLSFSFRYIVHFIKPFMITYVEEAIGEMITTAGPFPANMTWEEEMILSQLLQLWMLSTILPQEEMTLATLSEILLFDEYTQWHQQIHTGKCVISGSNVPLSTPSNASTAFCNVPGGWWLLGWQTI